MSDNTPDSGETAEPRVRKRATKKTARKAVKADAPAKTEGAPGPESAPAAAPTPAAPAAEPAKKHGDALAPAASDARNRDGDGNGGGGEGEVVWYVDPIDGTSNFAGGLPYYCVSIGVAWRGRLLGGVIYDPERDEMFVGSAEGLRLNNRAAGSRGQPRDSDSVCLTNLPHEGMDDRLGLEALGDLLVRFRAVRRLGSSALALAYVATGRADVCCELTTKPWDHAAGAALVLAGGGGFAGLDSGGRESGDMGAVAHYVAYGAGFGFSGSVLNAILNKAPGVRSDVQ